MPGAIGRYDGVYIKPGLLVLVAIVVLTNEKVAGGTVMLAHTPVVVQPGYVEIVPTGATQ